MIKPPNVWQSSQCDEVFVNEKSDDCNTNLLNYFSVPKIIHYITGAT